MDIKMNYQIKMLAKELQREFKLTNYEAISLALKVEQNKLLSSAFAISANDKYPSALEAIAIALGYKQ